MDELLRPVKITRNVQNNIQKFESLSLKEDQSKKIESIKIKAGSSINDDFLLKPTIVQTTIAKPKENGKPNETRRRFKQYDATVFLQRLHLTETSLFNNAKEVLKGQPTHEDLVAVLEYLTSGIGAHHDFNVHAASPRAAQIINILVTITIPEIWTNLTHSPLSTDELQIKKSIISVLNSAAGVGALLTRIQQLSSGSGNDATMGDAIMVLGEILKGPKTVSKFLKDSQSLYDKLTMQAMYWQEIVAYTAGGRILSTMAQALSRSTSSDNELNSYRWLGNGAEYTDWLAKNISYAAMHVDINQEQSFKHLSQLTRRGMGLGYRDNFVIEICSRLLLGQKALWTPLHLIIKEMMPYEQRNFFDSILSGAISKYGNISDGVSAEASDGLASQKFIAGIAALVAGLIKHNQILEQHIETLLVEENVNTALIGMSSTRALMVSLAKSEEKLQRLLEKALGKFGEKLYIQHVPFLQQEALARTILLAIGYLNRKSTDALRKPPLSTLVMHAVSNRLAASVPKARLLGMIIGTAVSRFVDRPDAVIDFGIEEMEKEDIREWLTISSIQDTEGNILDVKTFIPLNFDSTSRSQLRSTTKTSRKVGKPQISKIVAIEELSDVSETSEDDDLTPYKKPDSDPEDSEDDPTLINRNKPSAPVYIADLIKQLQMTDKPDVISVALNTAPSLIRRKAAFGTELSDNIRSLVSILVNLQQSMSDTELQRLRLDSLIVCIVAKTNVIGPSIADLYFQGDFSISQRLTLLTAIGLAVREIAGFEHDQSVRNMNTFPSKRLPAHLEPPKQKPIEPTKNPVAMLTDTAAHDTIRPMALAAADKATGPSALKIRTFSSRMDVEKKVKAKSVARTMIVPKNLHRILTESIYIPLCSRMNVVLSYSGTGRVLNTTILHSSTMRLFLQTLALTLHTLGPSASLQLPLLTQETLLMLINLHNIPHLVNDPAILPAALHLLLALLDVTIEAGVTAQERLLAEYGSQVAELVSWSNEIEKKGSVAGSEAEEEEGGGGVSWSVLAAGIQVKWFEIGRRFQSRMLGLTMDEMDQMCSA